MKLLQCFHRRIKDTKRDNQIQRHTYDDEDEDFVEMDEALDFMIPDHYDDLFKKDERRKKLRRRFLEISACIGYYY